MRTISKRVLLAPVALAIMSLVSSPTFARPVDGTCDDCAFWAGAEVGSYLLHHNKYVPDEE